MDACLRYKGTGGNRDSHKIKGKLTVNEQGSPTLVSSYKIVVNKISYSHEAPHETFPHYNINSWMFWYLVQVLVLITRAMTV